MQRISSSIIAASPAVLTDTAMPILAAPEMPPLISPPPLSPVWLAGGGRAVVEVAEVEPVPRLPHDVVLVVAKREGVATLDASAEEVARLDKAEASACDISAQIDDIGPDVGSML
jgi:hypothetical protein